MISVATTNLTGPSLEEAALSGVTVGSAVERQDTIQLSVLMKMLSFPSSSLVADGPSVSIQ